MGPSTQARDIARLAVERQGMEREDRLSMELDFWVLQDMRRTTKCLLDRVSMSLEESWSAATAMEQRHPTPQPPEVVVVATAGVATRAGAAHEASAAPPAPLPAPVPKPVSATVVPQARTPLPLFSRWVYRAAFSTCLCLRVVWLPCSTPSPPCPLPTLRFLSHAAIPTRQPLLEAASGHLQEVRRRRLTMALWRPLRI